MQCVPRLASCIVRRSMLLLLSACVAHVTDRLVSRWLLLLLSSRFVMC